MHHLTKAAGLLSAAAILSTAGLQMPSMASNGEPCENGDLVATYSFQSLKNNNFIIEKDGVLKAAQAAQPATSSEPGAFEVFNVSNLTGGTPNTYAIRSAQDPSRWWRMKRNNNNNQRVTLESVECRASRTSTTFGIQLDSGVVSFQARKNDRWIKVRNDGALKANQESPGSSTQFRVFGIDPSDPPEQPTTPGGGEPGGTVEPTPQGPQLGGWWRGNNSGYFQITQTEAPEGENNVEMIGYDNAGQRINRFDGRIIGTVLVGSWQDACGNGQGEITFEFTNDLLAQVNGSDTGNSRWERTNTPPSTLTDTCPDPQRKLTLKKKYTLFRKRGSDSTRTYEWEVPAKTIEAKYSQNSYNRLNFFYAANRPSTKCKGRLQSKDFDITGVDKDGNAYLSSFVQVYKGCSSSNQTKLEQVNDPNYITVEPGRTRIKTKKVEIKSGDYEGSYLRITYTLSNKDN